jgi:hypothetical protein
MISSFPIAVHNCTRAPVRRSHRSPGIVTPWAGPAEISKLPRKPADGIAARIPIGSVFSHIRFGLRASLAEGVMAVMYWGAH